MNTYILPISLSEVAAGTVLLFQAPTDGEGGGITVLSGGLAGSGTATVALHTFSNAGTPELNGTIAATPAGTISAGVPAAYTISDGWVDGGEFVGAVVGGTINDGSYLYLKYQMGR
jgi:hypothetical protein